MIDFDELQTRRSMHVVIDNGFELTVGGKDREFVFGHKPFAYSLPTSVFRQFEARKLVPAFFCLRPSEQAPTVVKDGKQIEARALLFLKNEGELSNLQLTSIYSTLPTCKY